VGRRGSGHDVRRFATAALLAGVISTVVVGCGTASEESPPSGVDELVIPTPSVDPQDFARAIDNPWLPLAAGATWTYRVSGAAVDVDADPLTVTVQDQTETVAGVSATVVESSGPDGDATDYYAQDRAGNVWWFGREGTWRAGEDGAQAGLVMPATPRVGDGWREAFLEGVVEDQAEVISLDATVTIPAGELDGLLEIGTSSPLGNGAGSRELYARGTGLVQWVTTSGQAYVAELVSGP
jgi:hypothetical protein